jgi:DNA-binding HxlR family transcriptional regulator
MISNQNLEPEPNAYAVICPSRKVLVLIGEKWVSLIVGALDGTVMRFGELKRVCEGISQKMLTQTLRKLERDGLVLRTLHADILPIKVEYRLTELGKSLLPTVLAAQLWAEENLHQIEKNRVVYDKSNQ